MQITILHELTNIAPKFTAAIWRKKEVNRTYKNAKEAKKYYNLRNCEYEYVNESGERIKYYNNAKIDSYGKRYN